MIEIINNVLCVAAEMLYTPYTDASGNNVQPVITQSVYSECANGRRRSYTIDVVQRACRGRKAMVAYDKLDIKLKEFITARLGMSPYVYVKNIRFTDRIKPDIEAAQYFENYRKPNGEALSQKLKLQYTTEACILNAANQVIAEKRELRKAMSIHGGLASFWEQLSEAINEMKEDQSSGFRYHCLPTSPNKLWDKAREYARVGYASLISGKVANTSTRKVNDDVERVILSLAADPRRLFNTQILDYYNDFLAGTIELFDTETGEVFDRTAFQKNGKPLQISLATVNSIVNKLENKVAIQKLQLSWADHQMRSPMVHFDKPNYSMSLISMDDRDSVKHFTDGKDRKRVSCYLATDVFSGSILCCVFGDKTVELINECFRALYRTCVDNNIVWAGEVQVEQHLMSSMKAQLEAMFLYATLLPAQNSRAKDAERTIRTLKYGTEKKNHTNIGRFYGKTDKFNINEDLKERFTREEVENDIISDIKQHNNTLHPDQKKYPNKTRWQVLLENQNPKLSLPKPEHLMQYIGYTTYDKQPVQIYNNQYIQFLKDKWEFPFELLSKLQSNNNQLMPYYLPMSDNTVHEIYLYQDNKFITTAERIVRAQKAKIERTPEDDAALLKQLKRKAQFHKYEKEQTGKIVKNLGSLKNQTIENVTNVQEVEQVVELVPTYEGVSISTWNDPNDF